jgi:hypothetical protein
VYFVSFVVQQFSQLAGERGIEINGIAHVMLTVRSVERSRAF